MNNLHKEITFSKIHHFTDDTNFLYERPTLKDSNRTINYDLSRTTHWLRANRMSLDVAKNKNNSIPFIQNKNNQKAKFSNKCSKNQNKHTQIRTKTFFFLPPSNTNLSGDGPFYIYFIITIIISSLNFHYPIDLIVYLSVILFFVSFSLFFFIVLVIVFFL